MGRGGNGTASESGAEAVRNACLVRAEEVLWEWVNEKKPGFRVNVVSPSNVIGLNFAPLPYAEGPGWLDWVWLMYHNGGRAPLVVEGVGPTQAHWYVDVEDVALLHIAAIFDERISNERLQAWGWYRDRNDAIDIMRDHTVLENRRILGNSFDFKKAWEEAARRYPIILDDGPPCPQIYPSSARALEIFADERWKGYGRWKEFEQTIRQSLAFFDAKYPLLKSSVQAGRERILSSGLQFGDIKVESHGRRRVGVQWGARIAQDWECLEKEQISRPGSFGVHPMRDGTV